MLHSHIITFVPNNTGKYILTQPDHEGCRGKWIAILLDYDLEIKLTKLSKGQGLAKLMEESNCDSLHIKYISNMSIEAIEDPKLQVSQDFVSSPWYKDIFYILQNLQAPFKLSRTKERSIKLKVVIFYIMNGYLY